MVDLKETACSSIWVKIVMLLSVCWRGWCVCWVCVHVVVDRWKTLQSVGWCAVMMCQKKASSACVSMLGKAVYLAFVSML